jgi:hypothetical protein
MAYNFQNEKSKLKLLTEFENATQTVLLFIELLCRMLKKLQLALSIFVSGLKIIGHGNPDKNMK